MAFTELFCRPNTGSNLNGGGLSTGAEPSGTAAYTCVNSNWDGTSVFTPTDGTTPATTVSVGDFASVYLDAATVAVYVARVTAVAAGVNGAITLSTTAKSGTAPATGATGRTIKVGGAWKGPNAAEAFPFGFITNALTNAAGDFPWINFKNSATYSITAAMTHANIGPIGFGGYTTTARDGGKATIDGGTTGAGYQLLGVSVNAITLEDLIFQNNGASGSSNGVQFTGSNTNGLIRKCAFNSVRGAGLSLNTGTGITTAEECEAYLCNQNNGSGRAGFASDGTAVGEFINCTSHDNTGSNSSGFSGNTFSCFGCIADTNGAQGFACPGGTGAKMLLEACEAYNNTSDGVRFSGSTGAPFILLKNCSFVKNGGFGVNGSAAGNYNGLIVNCGFGSGSQANTSGTTTGLKAIRESGSVTYPSGLTPWVDPANGDFRINLVQAMGTGSGVFTQTQAGYAGTVGYPDIGAATQRLILGSSSTLDAIYAIVNDANFGNAKLVRSTTPANTLDVSSTGEAGLDFNNIKDAGSAHTLTNIRVPNVTLTDTTTNLTNQVAANVNNIVAETTEIRST